ncbi:MAG: hypothetical protein J6K45_04755 [Clostridia bacterium]|nr:hypothetical protein [Clostridia bacterium]
MEEYVEELKAYIGDKRNWSKKVFNISGTLYRGVANKRFTWEQGLEYINSLGGNV